MSRARTAVAAWVCTPPLTGWLVIALGHAGALPWPPMSLAWPSWLVTVEPAVAVASTLAVAVVVSCLVVTCRTWWVVATFFVGRPEPLERRHDAGPSGLRRALAALARPAVVTGVGLGLVASPAGAGSTGARTAMIEQVEGGSDGLSRATGTAGDDHLGEVDLAASFAEMRRFRFALAAFTSPEVAAPPADAVWIVAPGDHLWSIAREILTEHLGATPDDRRTARYWRRLIEANRERLVVPGDADVILPGQQLLVPLPGGAGGQRSGT